MDGVGSSEKSKIKIQEGDGDKSLDGHWSGEKLSYFVDLLGHVSVPHLVIDMLLLACVNIHLCFPLTYIRMWNILFPSGVVSR